MVENHLVGTTIPFISPSTRCSEFGKSEENFKLMNDAGIKIVRAFGGFPFANPEKTEYSDTYKEFKEVVELYGKHGIAIQGTIANDSQYMVDGEGKVSCVIHAPFWWGTPDEDGYYDELFAACKFMAEDNKDTVTYWQIGNENDTDVFRGRLNKETNIRWLLTAARGVKAGNPDAKCMTNLAGLDALGQPGVTHSVHEGAKEMLKATYCIDDSPFDIIGLDAYFGSWLPGRPEYWHQYIDDADGKEFE